MWSNWKLWWIYIIFVWIVILKIVWRCLVSSISDSMKILWGFLHCKYQTSFFICRFPLCFLLQFQRLLTTFEYWILVHYTVMWDDRKKTFDYCYSTQIIIIRRLSLGYSELHTWMGFLKSYEYKNFLSLFYKRIRMYNISNHYNKKYVTMIQKRTQRLRLNTNSLKTVQRNASR